MSKTGNFRRTLTALATYNKLAQQSTKFSQAYATSISHVDTKLGNYLLNLKGAKVSMGGYITQLGAATLKTVALQAASMALNAILTMSISLAIQGVIELGKYLWDLIPTTGNLKKSLEETAQALDDIRSKREGLNDELKTTQERIAELEKKGALSFLMINTPCPYII